MGGSMRHERTCHSCLPVWFPEVMQATLSTTCLTDFSYVRTLFTCREIFSNSVLRRPLILVWQGTCVLFRTRQSACNNIFPHRCNALGRNISGMSVVVAFFCLLPSFVMVGITHHLWQISIGSICEEQECREQNKQRKHSETLLHDFTSAVYTLQLHELSFNPGICTWRNKPRPPSLCSSTDNVKRCEDMLPC